MIKKILIVMLINLNLLIEMLIILNLLIEKLEFVSKIKLKYF